MKYDYLNFICSLIGDTFPLTIQNISIKSIDQITSDGRIPPDPMHNCLPVIHVIDSETSENENEGTVAAPYSNPTVALRPSALMQNTETSEQSDAPQYEWDDYKVCGNFLT